MATILYQIIPILSIVLCISSVLSLNTAKKLRNEMVEKSFIYLEKVPGYLIECLVWNVPDGIFISENYYTVVKDVLVYLFDELARKNNYKEWGEVSELKYLFRDSQPWNKNDAQRFIKDAWNYIGYTND